MRTVILNGSDPSTSVLDRVAEGIEARSRAEGGTTRSFHLRHFAIGHCLGEFDCWVRTPGRCRIADEGQQIERAVHDADRLVVLSAVSFGGFGSGAKKAIDRLLPLILPFFEQREGLTHHAPRYAGLPSLIGIGLDAQPTPERSRLFAAIVESNALNLGAPGWGAAVLSGDPATWDRPIDLALQGGTKPGNASGTAEGARHVLDAAMRAAPMEDAWPARQRAAILLASARSAGTGTSEALARHVAAQFAARDMPAEIVPASAFARDTAAAEDAARRLAAADVIVIASPLYFDALPFLATLALERVRDVRRGAVGRPARLVGLLNCGFPEAEQLRFALLQLRAFAAEAGYHFAGALPVGGGESIAGRPLETTGGMTRHLRAALDEAAGALARGETVPEAASLAAARGMLPAPLYRLAGWWGWRWRARAHGLGLAALRARTFDALDRADWTREAAAGPLRARPLRVIAKLPETGEAVTVLFEDPAHDPLRHQAGQYLTVEAEIDGQRHRRAYSLSSAPGESWLSITVKRVPGGLVSNWIHDRLQVGDLLRSHGPSGSFTPEAPPPDRPRRLLLVGGGAGIVPLAAIARHLLATELAAEIMLIHGSAGADRAILADSLRSLAACHAPRFRLEPVLDSAAADWPGWRGRLDATMMDRLLPGHAGARFDEAMICGPDAMRAAVRGALLCQGLAADRIKEERFASPRPAEVPKVRQIACLLDGDARREIVVPPGATLLDAVLAAGEALSFSCLSGACGACRVRVIRGAENVVLDAPNGAATPGAPPAEVPACLARLRGQIEFVIG